MAMLKLQSELFAIVANVRIDWTSFRVILRQKVRVILININPGFSS